MLNLKQYRDTPDRLSDLLPFAALVAKGVVLNKDGSFQKTISYRGPDLDSATESELISISARVNNVLKRLDSGWALYSEAKRVEISEYPKSNFPDSISLLIDEERRLLFEKGKHFESSYYLTLIYLPPSDSRKKLVATFLESKDLEVSYEKVLENFIQEVARIISLLKGIFSEIKELGDAETLTYLHSTVSAKNHKIKTQPIYIDSIIADSDLLSGFKPKLGDKHLRVISVKGFPAKSQPGILDRLNRLSLEYRWVTRFIALDKSEAETELKKYKKRWFAKRKGMVTLLKEVVTGGHSVMEDSDAVNKAMDAEVALSELQDDVVSYGYFTTSIVLLDKNEEQVEVASKEVERVINSFGFSTKLEDVNAVDAWLGSIPGNCRNNVRRPLLNTLNLAHLMPLSSVWAGPKKDEHLNAPPLFYARTNGSTPFRFTPHVGDVGHTLVIGPTGSGKSVLLNMIEAQFLRYKDSQVYIFDKGGSARTLTYAVGGDYYDLCSEDSELSFQPLAEIDKPADLRFAHEWILDIFIQENVNITPKIKDETWIALKSLSTAPKKERTLFGLTVLLQNENLRKALLPYTIKGAYGEILDNTFDNLSYGFWQCFEMEVLMETPSTVMPVLSYLFHKLEQRFDGRPTILVLDEAWLFLDNVAFSAKIREWLKVLRKSNVVVIFATQSLTDIDQSSIKETIKEACFTKIYLPNAEALNEDTFNIYKRFGLNERQIRILAESIPKRQYYYTSPLGNRLFELGLGELALSYLAGTSKDKQALVKGLHKKLKDTYLFNLEFLKIQKLDYAVEHLKALSNIKETA